MKTWVHKWLRRWGFYGTLDTDKAIRALKTENIALKKENGELKQEVVLRRGFTLIEVDPTMRQRGYEQSAWNAEPERNTEPSRYAVYHEDMERNASPIQGARQRSAMHQVYPNKGDLMQHKNEMERKRFTTRQLDPMEETQHNVPNMPRKFTLMQHSEPLPDATRYMPATWLL